MDQMPLFPTRTWTVYYSYVNEEGKPAHRAQLTTAKNLHDAVVNFVPDVYVGEWQVDAIRRA
jgi:hypothetical protein